MINLVNKLVVPRLLIGFQETSQSDDKVSGERRHETEVLNAGRNDHFRHRELDRYIHAALLIYSFNF